MCKLYIKVLLIFNQHYKYYWNVGKIALEGCHVDSSNGIFGGTSFYLGHQERTISRCRKSI